MNKDESKQKNEAEEDAELDRMIDRVIREQSVFGDNPAADAARPLFNLIRASLAVLPDNDD
jgi:hypothetical protein